MAGDGGSSTVALATTAAPLPTRRTRTACACPLLALLSGQAPLLSRCSPSPRAPPPRSTAEAEDFFLHALERWRQEMGIERFILVGHSLGGYLSAVYALRHPERVEKLLLLGPAGVPAKPADFSPEAFRKRANVQPYTLRWGVAARGGAERGREERVRRRGDCWCSINLQVADGVGVPAPVERGRDARRGGAAAGPRGAVSHGGVHQPEIRGGARVYG